MSGLFVVVVLTVGVSAACSLLEATLYSTRAAALEAAAADGGRRAGAARRLLDLKRDIAAPTSAILILNTVANTAGATLAGVLAVVHFGASALTPVSIALTLAILFLSEIAPKTYAATHWRKLWPVTAWTLWVLVRVMRPALWLTAIVVRDTKHSPPQQVPKDEVQAMIRIGQRDGSIHPTEAKISDAALQLGRLRCRDVTVPAACVTAVNVSGDVASAVARVAQSQHTRYPLCDGGLGACIGIVHAKDLIAATPDTPLMDLARPIARLDADAPLHVALRQLQAERLHMALILDGQTPIGIATLEDILEQLVGPVMDEFDTARDDRALRLVA